MSDVVKILLFTGTLQTGGSERQFAQLAVELARREHHVAFATIYPGGSCWRWLQNQEHGKIALFSLFSQKSRTKLGTALQIAWAAWRLRYFVARCSPQILYSALYASNWIAWLATRGRRSPLLVWGLRTGDNAAWTWKKTIPFHLCRLVSGTIPLTIANSHAAFLFHQRNGFRPHLPRIVANGIDTERFSPNAQYRRQIRQHWNFAEDQIVVGAVGRIVAGKGHDTFIDTACLLARQYPQMRFVCIGSGPRFYIQTLQKKARQCNVEILWYGEVEDVERIYNGLDVLCSASCTEGFANVIAEAMSCGIPCAATDVGDTAHIIGDTGQTAPVADSPALAKAVADAVAKKLCSEGIRARVVENFSLARLGEETEQVLANLLRRDR